MKKIFILAVAAIALAACTKEKTPVPTRAKNWLEITEPAAGADEVDRKIWDIYQRFGVPVFYTDTLGSVDYGMVDEEGNPVLSYQMIYPAEDMTQSGGNLYPTAITRVQHWIPAEKAKMMPMLEFVESTLLPLAEKGEIRIPVVFVAQNYTVNYTSQRTNRSGNVFTVNMSLFNPFTTKQFQTDLLIRNAGRAWDGKLAPFYGVVEDLLMPLTDNPWSGNNGPNIMWTSIVSKALPGTTWLQLQANNWYVTNYATQYPNLELYPDFYAGDVAMVAWSYQKMAEWQVLMDQRTLWTQRYVRYNPMSYGLTNYAGLAFGYAYNIDAITARTTLDNVLSSRIVDFYSTPTKQADLAAYLTNMLNMPQTTLELPYMFGNWPVVLERFDILRGILLDMDIDIEVIAGRKQIL